MAVGSILTVDQGNSTASFVVWALEGDRARVLQRSAELGSLPGGLERVMLSSVADPVRRSGLVAELEARSGLTVEVPEPGLELAIRHPETCGLDRLFAARAADARHPRGAHVVDCGTALTVDLVLDGVYQGGAIAPGAALLAEALAAGGAQLYGVAARPGAPALGRETRAALEAGVVVGLRGTARELVVCQAREAGSEGLPVLVTGGGRALLLEPTPCFGGVVEELRDLVHEGLLLAGVPGVRVASRA